MATVRITGGDHRGRKVQLPKQHDLRPTSDRARQAFFNILGPRVSGASFLDLFAGTGIFAFEALSRGAASAVAVDQSRHAARQMSETAKLLGLDLSVICDDVFAALKRLQQTSFDVVYADPPYDFGKYDQLVAAIAERVTLNERALVAIEHRTREIPTSPTAVLRRSRTAEYGSVSFTLFEKEVAS